MSSAAYERETLLGTGGMAEVWLARGPAGRVALKCLLPHAARNPSLAAAFEREGRLLQRIRHANIVAIHDIVRTEQGPLLVLEYVEGVDLRATSRARIPLGVALRVIRDILQALEAVHGLCDETGRRVGLIHRDLSPSNVLIGVDGSVKLADFGIARALTGTHATTGLQIKGTLAYLSPEQASGAPTDMRSDLFAVGAILYELLAGVPIYDEADARLALARARAGDVDSIGQRRADLAPRIAEFVDHALAARPGDRFPSAAAMGAELDQVAEDAGGLASRSQVAEWARSAAGTALPASAGRESAGSTSAGSTSAGRESAVASAGRASGRPAGAVPAPDGEAKLHAGVRKHARWGIVAAALFVIVGGLGWRYKRGDTPLVPASPGGEPPLVPDHEVERANASLTVALPAAPSSDVGAAAMANERVSGMGADVVPETPVAVARSSGTASVAPSPPARPNRPVANSARSRATLDLGSEPGFAYVTIDGVRVGATPLFGYELAPGTHRVEVSRDGVGSKAFSVDVRSGERIRRIIKLR